MRHQGHLKRALQGDVPPAFCHLLERLLSNDPEGRPQTAQQLSVSLMKLLPDKPNSDSKQFNPIERQGIDEIPERNPGVIVSAFISAYPGAGATFASLAFSSSMSRAGLSHALVECPGGEAELYGLLYGSREMPKGAVFSDPSGQGASVPAWRKGKAAYYPLNPQQPTLQTPYEAFTTWLRRLGVPIVLLDVSSRWDNEDYMSWLVQAADQIWIVADCYPAKWSSRRQEACTQLQAMAVHRGRKIGWMANRDQRFEGRKQWLSLFPAPQAAAIPQLPNHAVLSSLWLGKGIPDDPQTAQLLDEAFQKNNLFG